MIVDMAFKGDKKIKKVIVVFSGGVLLVCTIAIIASILAQIPKSEILVYRNEKFRFVEKLVYFLINFSQFFFGSNNLEKITVETHRIRLF